MKKALVCAFLLAPFPFPDVFAKDDNGSAKDPNGNVPRLQVRLIRASNDPAENSDPRVKSLNVQLKADFGYKNYQQIFFSESQFTRDEKAIFEMPDEFGITITYHGRKKGNREFFVETSYRGKKFVGFYASFPDNSRPVLIRGPGTRDTRYIIALSLG
ncbi:MAG: hypothetical protein HY360_04910 [Verrucomicrobia bacterium]|nr:hypothetical protein [Verrucomicrobiota bacterium]